MRVHCLNSLHYEGLTSFSKIYCCFGMQGGAIMPKFTSHVSQAMGKREMSPTVTSYFMKISSCLLLFAPKTCYSLPDLAIAVMVIESGFVCYFKAVFKDGCHSPFPFIKS